MKFIHTFSLMKVCEEDELKALRANYGKDSFLYNSSKKIWPLTAYTNWGLRVEIRPIPNDSGKRKFNKKHPLFEMIIIITPAKLLNPGVALGGLTSRAEIEEACVKLNELVNVIEEKSDVNILSETSLWRVDLTKDQLTPSDLYSHEIIGALKKSIKKTGYHLYDPRVHDDYNIAWHQEDAMLFHNDNQQIGGKVYNKKRDLILNKRQKELKKIGEKGLLRFELSLLHKRLKEDYGAGGHMTCEQLAEILYIVTNDASKLFETYFSQVFFSGAMVSRGVMKALIKEVYPGKNKRLDEMLYYSDSLTGKKVKKPKRKLSNVQIMKRKSWFNQLDISPISVCRECPYIPSVAGLLENQVDFDLLEFAECRTFWHFDILYWKKRLHTKSICASV